MTAWCGLRSLQLKLYRRKIRDVAWFFSFYGEIAMMFDLLRSKLATGHPRFFPH